MKRDQVGTKSIRILSSIVAQVMTWSLVMAAMATAAWAEIQTEGDLVVHIRGFAHARGQAVASLFYAGDDIFGRPHARVAAPIQQDQATLVFPHLSYGTYAVTAFHDENGNNDLDHNFFHFPAEPLGFSNGFKLSLFSGMPSFEKLRFVFGTETSPLEITVK